MYEISFDAERNRLTIRLSGFWRPEDVSAYAAAVHREGQAARAISQDFDVIVESAKFPVQSSEVAEKLGEVMARSLGLSSGRIAVVVDGHLARLQAQRQMPHPRVCVVLSLEEADALLAAPGGAAPSDD